VNTLYLIHSETWVVVSFSPASAEERLLLLYYHVVGIMIMITIVTHGNNLLQYDYLLQSFNITSPIALVRFFIRLLILNDRSILRVCKRMIFFIFILQICLRTCDAVICRKKICRKMFVDNFLTWIGLIGLVCCCDIEVSPKFSGVEIPAETIRCKSQHHKQQLYYM